MSAIAERERGREGGQFLSVHCSRTSILLVNIESWIDTLIAEQVPYTRLNLTRQPTDILTILPRWEQKMSRTDQVFWPRESHTAGVPEANFVWSGHDEIYEAI